ncbi:tetratricopeptide repeat protein [Schlesneria sp. DSM 10557]|uniref:tetratricopeptide repeat protein n=1 Tax=Schlesneria sp. DSM 10557 TaxID=3044399 RepID=UPI0035A16C25
MKLIATVSRLLCVFLLMTGQQVSAADSGAAERSFVRALELFDSAKSTEDYLKSASELESIVADGYRNGAVYYNLGNAYFRAGQFGRAILNYRKARSYLPTDPYLKANLEQALAMAPGRLTEVPQPWWTHVFFWTDWLSFPSKCLTFLIGMSISAVAAVVAFWFRRPRFCLPIAGLVVASLAMGLDAWLTDPELLDADRAVITRETIARKGTGEAYEAAFDHPLRDGAEFRVLGETPGWTFGHFEGIGDGWIRNDCVAR